MFNDIHRHSDYSLLDSSATIDHIVEESVARKAKHIVVTDHGSLAGCYKLWKACRKVEITPVLGCECYCVTAYDSEEGKLNYNYFHLVLLAMNVKGWANLKKLQEIAWETGFKSRPRVQLKDLEKYNEGLIVSTACIRGLVGELYLGFNKVYQDKKLAKRKKLAVKRLTSLKKIFGDRLYLEIHFNDLPMQVKLNKYIMKLGKAHHVPVVVGNDSHYVFPGDSKVHDVVKCKQFRKKLDDPDNGTYSTKELWMKTQDELSEARKKWHPSISEAKFLQCCKENTKLLKRIENFDILPEGSPLPVISKQPDKDLMAICKKHREYKMLMKKSVYKKRFKMEYETISKLGFSNYFLVVWDIARFTREEGIPYNARGSVNGSLVAYFMGITWIDPIRFDCPFERFLTKDRLSLPDIDMDFGQKQRKEVMAYVCEKYGQACVAQIINFSKWKPKGAIKDAARILGYSFDEVNSLTRVIKDDGLPPNATDAELEKSWNDLQKYPAMASFLEENEDVATLAQGMLGVNYQMGVHASGLIVTPTRLTDWCPIAYRTEQVKEEKKRVKVTEWDMYDLEDAGILKLDILGQKTLDVIKDAVISIGQRHKVKFHDFDTLCEYLLGRLKDKKVYKMIGKGKNVGLFQLGTDEGSSLSKEILPVNLDDISAIISLDRPAILKMGMHKEFVKRRFGQDYTLQHEKMHNVLDETYGILIFQEQSSALAVVLAGFTPTEADHFRKGIKLKDVKKIKPWRKKFLKGCKTYSKIDRDTAIEIWKFIEAFGAYGFNRSHSIAYAFIAYMTAYLKCYYPAEFMTSLLTHNTDDDKKLASFLAETRRLGLKTSQPHINKSTGEFTLDDTGILYPLNAVKQVGTKAIDAILEARKDGKFSGLKNFIKRVDNRVVNIGVMVNAVLSNCFREFGSRSKVFDRLLRLKNDKKTCRQIYCYDCKRRYPVSKSYKDIDAKGIVCPNCGDLGISTDSKVCKGKKFHRAYIHDQVFGFSLQTHKLKQFVDILAKEGAEPLLAIDDKNEQSLITVGFEVVKIKKHVDKNGNEMAFLDITDGDNESNIVVFASDWISLQEHIQQGGCFIGRFRKNRGKLLYDSNNSSLSKLVKTYKGKE